MIKENTKARLSSLEEVHWCHVAVTWLAELKSPLANCYRPHLMQCSSVTIVSGLHKDNYQFSSKSEFNTRSPHSTVVQQMNYGEINTVVYDANYGEETFRNSPAHSCSSKYWLLNYTTTTILIKMWETKNWWTSISKFAWRKSKTSNKISLATLTRITPILPWKIFKPAWTFCVKRRVKRGAKRGA